DTLSHGPAGAAWYRGGGVPSAPQRRDRHRVAAMASLVASLLLGGILLDGNLRLEGRSGPAVAGQPGRTATAGAGLAMEASQGHLVLRAGVAPQAVIVDSGGSVGDNFFCRAHVAAELRGEEIWRLELRQVVGYGWLDVSPLRGLPAPAPDAPPGVQPP